MLQVSIPDDTIFFPEPQKITSEATDGAACYGSTANSQAPGHICGPTLWCRWTGDTESPGRDPSKSMLSTKVFDRTDGRTRWIVRWNDGAIMTPNRTAQGHGLGVKYD